VAIGTLLLVAGLGAYLLTVPRGMVDPSRQAVDTYALFSGMSVLRITNAGVWALGLTPAPVFLTAYFLARRRYVPAAAVGSATFLFFVLTSDLSTVPALVGALGAAAIVGFGQLDREGSNPAIRNTLLVVLVAMMVVTTSVSLVPGGEARPLVPDRSSTTVETSLTASDASVEVVGSISLSPAARFSVEADEGRYWKVGAYDRYTGDGWVRTGGSEPYERQLPPPEADDLRSIRQRFEAESEVATMPAAWKPARLEFGGDRATVTDLEGLEPTEEFSPGEGYTVLSLVPETSTEELRTAGTDYPTWIEDRYLQLPESTPDRLGRFTSNLTAEADSPYEQAVVIERWLESNKAYSLDVDRPGGDVASGFVFGMDRGYCTYYATAMVTMLRSQGVPARFVVGYTTGQQVAEDRWLIRGLDSHAWVEVYFPDVGWVQFDPTPAAPRGQAERDTIQTARESGFEGVDTDESRDLTPTPSGALEEESGATGGNGTAGGSNATGTAVGSGNASLGPDSLNPFGSPLVGAQEGESEDGLSAELILYAVVLLLGAATAVYRLGIAERLYRELWLRRLPGGSPSDRVEAAVARVEYLLGRRYRPRARDETRRAYVQALSSRGVDDRAVQLYRLGERARFAGRATEEEAESAVRLLAELRRERSRLG
jgi:transglutaminase-like putative cysteine protease